MCSPYYRPLSSSSRSCSMMGVTTTTTLTTLPTLLVKVVLGLLLYGTVITESQVTFQDKSDYCQLESFNVSCGEGEIIVLVSALYGRMRPGRCITRSYGNLGCSANVLPYMDTRCSGQRSCVVPIPDPMLHRTQPCPKDFTTYLEVEYQCIKVTRSHTADCPEDPGGLHLDAGEGYLAGVLVKPPSALTGALRSACPWRISAQPGQAINISLVNFNNSRAPPYSGYSRPGGGKTESGGGTPHHRGPCMDVATVVDGTVEEALQLCRHQQREVTAYVSRAHDITLHLPHHAPGHRAGMFLLRYKAVGCPDVRAQAGLWVRRTGDTAMVRCNLTEETWYLSCEGNDWKGRVGNCSQAAKKWNMDDTAISEEPVPYGILITVAIGAALGIFLGGVLLAVVLLIRRYRMTTPREPQESDYQIRDNLPRKSFDIDKGYAPVLDERGHFPVSAERFPLPVSIPQCPEPTLLCGTTATTTTATTLPVDVTMGGTLPRDTVRIDAPIFCSHPECHVYETTRLGLTNQNKRPS